MRHWRMEFMKHVLPKLRRPTDPSATGLPWESTVTPRRGSATACFVCLSRSCCCRLAALCAMNEQYRTHGESNLGAGPALFGLLLCVYASVTCSPSRSTTASNSSDVPFTTSCAPLPGSASGRISITSPRYHRFDRFTSTREPTLTPERQLGNIVYGGISLAESCSKDSSKRSLHPRKWTARTGLREASHLPSMLGLLTLTTSDSNHVLCLSLASSLAPATSVERNAASDRCKRACTGYLPLKGVSTMTASSSSTEGRSKILALGSMTDHSSSSRLLNHSTGFSSTSSSTSMSSSLHSSWATTAEVVVRVRRHDLASPVGCPVSLATKTLATTW
mmetsp:Transcript_20468/g.65540  ORF Transcript_20468/g.65540 Transcript_20468/m.65540 type:complete len:334 (-) Transcript_20468:516-1517(-)